MIRRLRAASAREIDIMLAGALFVAGCLELASGLAGAPPVVQFLALPLQTLTLSQRRAHPVWVIGIVLLGLALPAVFGVPQNASVIPLIGYVVAVYSASAERPWPLSGVGLLVAVVGVSVVIALGPKHDASDLLFGIVVTGVAFGAGRVQRLLTDQNRRLAEAREELARAAVAEERTRIARELHDVLAHAISVMVVHSAAAREVLDHRPEATREALETIESTGRQALDEMHRLVGLLRTGEAPGLQPQGRLGQLDVLVEQLRSTGLSVDVQVEGEQRALPPGLDMSAYRILQEALTNVLKHGGGAAARVRIRYAPELVELDVVDEGYSNGNHRIDRSPVRNSGHGLVGMRERASLYGGKLEAGPRPEGGFRVHAVLPVPAA